MGAPIIVLLVAALQGLAAATSHAEDGSSAGTQMAARQSKATGASLQDLMLQPQSQRRSLHNCVKRPYICYNNEDSKDPVPVGHWDSNANYCPTDKSQKQLAGEALVALVKAGYYKTAWYLQKSGILENTVDRPVTFLAAQDVAYTKERLPERLYNLLSSPDLTGRTIVHLMKFNTLLVYQTFWAFLRGGQGKFATYLSESLVNSDTQWSSKNARVLFTPQQPTSQKYPADVRHKALFCNELVFIMGTDNLMIPDNSYLYYNTPPHGSLSPPPPSPPPPGQNMLAEEAIQALEAAGYTITAQYLRVSGVLNCAACHLSFLAPTNAAYSKGRLPDVMYNYLHSPNLLGRSIVHLMKYHTLPRYNNFGEFVSAGDRSLSTLLSSAFVKSQVTNTGPAAGRPILAFLSVPRRNTKKATVVQPNLFQNSLVIIQGINNVLIPPYNFIFYQVPPPPPSPPPPPHVIIAPGPGPQIVLAPFPTTVPVAPTFTPTISTPPPGAVAPGSSSSTPTSPPSPPSVPPTAVPPPLVPPSTSPSPPPGTPPSSTPPTSLPPEALPPTAVSPNVVFPSGFPPPNILPPEVSPFSEPPSSTSPPPGLLPGSSAPTALAPTAVGPSEVIPSASTPSTALPPTQPSPSEPPSSTSPGGAPMFAAPGASVPSETIPTGSLPPGAAIPGLFLPIAASPAALSPA